MKLLCKPQALTGRSLSVLGLLHLEREGSGWSAGDRAALRLAAAMFEDGSEEMLRRTLLSARDVVSSVLGEDEWPGAWRTWPSDGAILSPTPMMDLTYPIVAGLNALEEIVFTHPLTPNKVRSFRSEVRRVRNIADRRLATLRYRFREELLADDVKPIDYELEDLNKALSGFGAIVNIHVHFGDCDEPPDESEPLQIASRCAPARSGMEAPAS